MNNNKGTTERGQDIADLTEEQAREHLEGVLWPLGPVCPHCKSRKSTRMGGESHRDGLLQCNDCRKQFTVTVGTIFEDSHIPLRKWLRAIHLMCSSKKGISALQLQRNLGLGSYRTAWYLAQRVRLAMSSGLTAPPKMKGAVECDDTLVGGVKKVKFRRNFSEIRSNKTVVLSVVERDGKKVSFVQDKVTGKNLKQAVNELVERGTPINTDDAMANKLSLKGWRHYTVNHTKKEYARREPDGTLASTNTVESTFSLLKRGVIGTFHHLSRKHLHRYCAEFDFRWNERKVKDKARVQSALEKTTGRRLTYREVVGEVE